MDIIRRYPPKSITAVDGISFEIKRTEILGLVGRSGCGKTTTARIVTHLISPTRGNVLVEGIDMFHLNPAELRKMRKRVQMVFQDPYSSLNPRKTIFETVSESLRIHRAYSDKKDLRDKVCYALEEVGLKSNDDWMNKYPQQLSGGERQRVAIARAIVLRPSFVIWDEPVSMLDASIRAEILRLILKLRDAIGLTCLFITHDLAVARYICDKIAVMDKGKIVELGEAEEIILHPQHPHTRMLISAVLDPYDTSSAA